jgi:hypothetical protein
MSTLYFWSIWCYLIKKYAFLSKTRTFLSDPKHLTGSVYILLPLFNYASQLRTHSYLPWRPTPDKPGLHWAYCAPPYGTPNHGRLWYGLDSNQGICSDASGTEMQCLRPLRHLGTQTSCISFRFYIFSIDISYASWFMISTGWETLPACLSRPDTFITIGHLNIETMLQMLKTKCLSTRNVRMSRCIL